MSYAERIAQELQDRAMPIGETDGLHRITAEADAEIAALRAELDNVREAFELKDNAYLMQKEATEQYRARVEALEAGIKRLAASADMICDDEACSPSLVRKTLRAVRDAARALLKQKP